MVWVASVSCRRLWRVDAVGVPSKRSRVGVWRRAPRLSPPGAREDTRSLEAVEAGQPMVARAALSPHRKLLQSGAGLCDIPDPKVRYPFFPLFHLFFFFFSPLPASFPLRKPQPPLIAFSPLVPVLLCPCGSLVFMILLRR